MERLIKQNYNRLSKQGIDYSDSDFIETFKLDPAIANTPEINNAMLDLMYRKNVENYMNIGHSEGKAKAEAGRLRAQTKKEIALL